MEKDPATKTTSEQGARFDLNRARDVDRAATDVIDDMFNYHAWSEAQTVNGINVRNALIDAVRVIIANVPPSPDRTVAIRKLREARMDCNSAITHGGKY